MSFIEALEQIDRNATLAINSLHGDFFDQVWMLFSHRTIWIPLYLAMAGVLIWKLGWKKGLLAIFAAALCILCVDQFCNLVKDTVARLRPCNDPYTVANGLWILEAPSAKYPYGFFSAHAGNAVAFALFTVLALRNRFRIDAHAKVVSTALLLWAFLVGVSRIFVGKHYLGDVLVGFIVGAVISWIIYKVYNLVERKAIPA